ncbi:hypothetical protein ACPPVU_22520 [Mucilaginibacter sp. McL0603]|uniref:hypothetical protein n=1 Tax=Mucilaginibacter sp. McL0603 TaxID=3415670 RepID=UPI003CEA4705
MRRSFLLIILLSALLSTCKKDQLTPDGKPSADAKKNILRIDASAGASYYLSVAEFDPSKGQSVADATYYLLKNDLTSPYECVFTATPGNILFVEVYTTGPTTSCDIYYKGIRVTSDGESDIFNSNNAIAPSHTNITYQIPN